MVQQAVDTAACGNLVHGAGWLWVEPAREDLHRRAVDAHLRLAEFEERLGHLLAAEAVWSRWSTWTVTPRSPTAGSWSPRLARAGSRLSGPPGGSSSAVYWSWTSTRPQARASCTAHSPSPAPPARPVPWGAHRGPRPLYRFWLNRLKLACYRPSPGGRSTQPVHAGGCGSRPPVLSGRDAQLSAFRVLRVRSPPAPAGDARLRSGQARGSRGQPGRHRVVAELRMTEREDASGARTDSRDATTGLTGGLDQRVQPVFSGQARSCRRSAPGAAGTERCPWLPTRRLRPARGQHPRGQVRDVRR